MVSLQAALTALALSSTGQTVLLDFYSDSCGPCRAMAPIINELAATFPIRKVNVAREPELAAQYRVQQIPCYVMLVDGKEVDRVVGGTSFSRIERMCRLGVRQSPPNQLAAAAGPTSPPAALPKAVFIPATNSGHPLSAAAHPRPVTTRPEPKPAAVVDWQQSQHDWTPIGDDTAAADAPLVAASVRLRIEDAHGHSCGSGTIIDARAGQALILTCGHIFRDSQGKGRIEVNLFGPGGEQKVLGQLVSYDPDRDVGLVAVDTPGPVAVARVAPRGYAIQPGDPVMSVGCNNGDRPSARHSRVTAINKFQGPPNLQVADRSVEGRSGGGLFSSDALVIGVCNAHGPGENESLYAALAAIHAELDKTKLSYVYLSPGTAPSSRPVDPIREPAGRSPRGPLVAVAPPAMPKQMPSPSEFPRQGNPVAGSIAGGEPSRLGPTEQAALDEIRRHLEQGAEVICVVRSRRDPQAKSQIIMLDRVSPSFIEQLAAEGGVRNSPDVLPTRLDVPRKASTMPNSLRWAPPRSQTGSAADGWR